MTGTRVLVRESPGEWVKLMVILSEAGGTEQPASHSPEAGAGDEEEGAGYTISWATASGIQSDSDRELLLSPSDLQSLDRFWWASVTSFRYLHSIFFLYLLESGMVGEGERPGDPAEAESLGEALVLTDPAPPLSLFSWPGSTSPNRSPVSVLRLVTPRVL